MMSFQRVHFRHMDSKFASSENYTFDISVDSDGYPIQKMAFFGFWGQLQRFDNLYPAILMPNGDIYLGAAYHDDENIHKSNILSRKIEVGNLVSIVWPNKTECILRISQITPL